ncbi:MAG: alpha/beta fold hydrolase [Rhodanobacteraceae bacterium]|nr:alpha/beta fold hydrolase [Rhodanobacteraceae bacterium]
MHSNDDDSTTLAIHGAGGGGWEWEIWRRVWAAQQQRFVAPDLMPGADGLGRTAISDYLDQLRHVAAALRRPCLIGASLGGLLALLLAQELDAAALVLVDPVPPSGIAPRPVARAATGDIVPWGSQRRFDSTRRALPDADAAAQHHAFRRWRDESAAVLLAAQAGVAAPSPRCPVLVIAATRDEVVPTATSLALAQQLGAEFWRCGCSHVGALLGRSAAMTASRVHAWVQSATIVTAKSQVPPGTE